MSQPKRCSKDKRSWHDAPWSPIDATQEPACDETARETVEPSRVPGGGPTRSPRHKFEFSLKIEYLQNMKQANFVSSYRRKKKKKKKKKKTIFPSSLLTL